MSTTRERKRREFEAREQLFLRAAQERILSEGLLAFQMAPIAETCEYSTGTLYQHFSSKEDLLVALATEQAKEFTFHFLRAANWRATTRERIFALVVLDHRFRERRPDYALLTQYIFTEVVWKNASLARRKEMTESCGPCIEAACGIIASAVEEGDLRIGKQSPEEISMGIWALSRGVHSLMLTKGFLDSMGIRDPGRILFHQIQGLLNGLGWQPLFDLSDLRGLNKLIRKVDKEVIGDAF